MAPPLETRRSEVLGQLFFCEGCRCGQTDKGFPPLPKQMIKEYWKRLKLNATIQLTISGIPTLAKGTLFALQ